MLWRSRLIAQRTAIALTYAIEAAGSRRPGGVMVSVFFMCCLFVVVGRLWDVGCGFGVYSTRT